MDRKPKHDWSLLVPCILIGISLLGFVYLVWDRLQAVSGLLSLAHDMSGRIRRCSVRFAGGESRNYMRGMVSYTQRSLAMTVCSDRRQGKPSPKRVPVAGVEQVLGLLRSVFRSERAAFP